MNISVNISIDISALQIVQREYVPLTDNQGNEITDNNGNQILVQ